MRTNIEKHDATYTDDSLETTLHGDQMLISSAQATLSDLDKTILELADLVQGLKNQSEKLAI